jgi:peptidoglycan/LPS O-acetylase OafA/YrhL
MHCKDLSEKITSKIHQRRLAPVLWTISVGFLWFHIFKALYMNMSPMQRLLYMTVERELFSLSICIIIFLCHSLGSGGIIRTFLSHPFWQPLSKLCLSIFILHFPFILYTARWFSRPLDFFWYVHLFSGDFVVLFLASIVAFVLVEAPFSKIIDFVWKKVIKL